MTSAKLGTNTRAIRGLAGNPWYEKVPTRWHGDALGIQCAQSWTPWLGTRQGVELIPMLWGHNRTLNGVTRNLYFEFLQRIPTSYNGWVIMFNEPADAGQANMTPQNAAWIWTDFAHTYPAAKLTSPQMLIGLDNASGFDFYGRAQQWLSEWYALLPQHVRPRITAWAWHVYHSDATTAINAHGRWMSFVDSLKAGCEYWVTEWGVNAQAHSGQGAEVATRTIANYLDGHTDRHFVFTNKVDDFSAAWSGYNLIDSGGGLTPVGRGWMPPKPDKRHRLYMPLVKR